MSTDVTPEDREIVSTILVAAKLGLPWVQMALASNGCNAIIRLLDARELDAYWVSMGHQRGFYIHTKDCLIVAEHDVANWIDKPGARQFAKVLQAALDGGTKEELTAMWKAAVTP